MIPALLLKKAKINKEVSIVGAFDHLQSFSSELLDSSLEKEE
jgi:DNA-binding transcriptional regulator/RsmH inhibitor MraZ